MGAIKHRGGATEKQLGKLQESTKQEYDSCGAVRTLERCRAEKEETIEALMLKDDEILFPRGHAAQLTQSLKPILFATR